MHKNNNDPYNMANKSIDELIRVIAGRNPDTVDHQYAKVELEKRKTASRPNITTEKTSDIVDGIHYPWKKLFFKIFIGVITTLISVFVIWGINHYFTLGL